MRITLSAAVTADGFLDDTTSQRLVISTPEDWAAVRALRATQDAILVGAETLRRDNPALVHPPLIKVTVTDTGDLSPELRFFTEGTAAKYVFSTHQIPELQNTATVISTDGLITAKWLVTELEKRGVERLLVEGGAKILRMFLDEGMADVLRLAVNPTMRLGSKGGAHFNIELSSEVPHTTENAGGMEVTTYTLRPDRSTEDMRRLQQAVAEGHKCTPSETSYCVGAVVVTEDGHAFCGYTHETSPTHHAEQEAINKALAAEAVLAGAAMYSSMEPCSQRVSEPESCTQLLIRYGFARAVFASYEPDRFARCQGALTLREAGLDVRVYPIFAEEVRKTNAHLLR